MKYIKIDDDTFVEYDKTDKTSQLVFKSAIESEIALTQSQISALPPVPSNAELLAWAKANYDNSDIRSRDVLEKSVNQLQNKLDKIKLL